jgi:outer membrane autotransporter protein
MYLVPILIGCQASALVFEAPEEPEVPSIPGGVSAGGVVASSPSRRVIEKLLLSAREENATSGAQAFQMTRDFEELDLVRSLGLVGETALLGLLSFEAISRDATQREVGFDSLSISGYGGISFALGANVTVGVGIELSHWSGDFVQGPGPESYGGDFFSNGFGPVAYVSVDIFERGFIQAWASYEFEKIEQSKNGLFIIGNPSKAEASIDGRELNLGAGSIFYVDAGRFVLSPELGLDFVRQRSDQFTETWEEIAPVGGPPSFVEQRFEDDERTSLQSALGLGISTTVQWRDLRLEPYIALGWVHEFLDDARTIRASRIDATGGDLGTFPSKTDDPDRDWFELSGEVSFEMANGINASLAAQIELDHRFYDRASIFGGISIPLN